MRASVSGSGRPIDVIGSGPYRYLPEERVAGARAHRIIHGTPKMIADEMEEWLTTRASDGFTLQFPYLPMGLDDVVDRLVPELQRRGLFRTEYEGTTLREHLGLPRPENQFYRRNQAAE